MFAASRTNPSLFRQLENGVVHCGLTEDERSATFLPESVVYEVLTKESITATLSWSQRLYSRWSPGNSLTDKIHSRARKVFAVLILIGEESKISDLIYNDGITDDHLPLVLEYDGAMIMSRHSSKRFHSFKSWDARRVRDFLDWQWVVLAPVLDMTDKHGKHIILDPKCPLPIENSVLKERGSHVSLYQAHLHPAHQLCPHGAQPVSSVAIKEVEEKARFERERENLQNITALGHPHLIKVLASYEKGPFGYFIFPWAQGGNLWEFWGRENQSPRTGDFVQWNLEQMLGLMDAIQVLHENNIRHGDIKPQNILYFTVPMGEASGHGTLVLADFGVSKFHEFGTGLRNAVTETMEATVFYEAPEVEYDRRQNRPRSRRYDMWSAGCMLLEFTVWLLYGFDAITEFRRRRISASRNEPNARQGPFFEWNSEGQFKVNSRVTKGMQILRKDPRCKRGTALGELLVLIEDRLLQIDPNKRADARELYQNIVSIVAGARESPKSIWERVDLSPDIPKFFAKGPWTAPRLGGRKSSNSSEASLDWSTSRTREDLSSADSSESESEF